MRCILTTFSSTRKSLILVSWNKVKSSINLVSLKLFRFAKSRMPQVDTQALSAVIADQLFKFILRDFDAKEAIKCEGLNLSNATDSSP